jgi:RNA-binding protein
MFTSKQRSHLKSLGANLEPVMQVGKEGIGENLLHSLSEALEARELVKITLLETATDSPKEMAAEIAASLNAEVVIVMGRKALLYRRSSRKNFKHIEY